MRRRWLAAGLTAAGAALGIACANAGEDRLVGISGSAVVQGFVFQDLNGSRALDQGDDSLANVRIKLVALGDSVAGAASQPSGRYTMSGVPVGTYGIVVDLAPFTDTVVIARLDSTQVTVRPGDTVRVDVLLGYPHVSIAQARALPMGRKVFLVGVALNNVGIFRDTTVHFQDSSGALRLARILTPGLGANDSVRVRGTTFRRANQPTLELSSVVLQFGPTQPPTAPTLTTAQAAGAASATRDAQAIVVDSALISDTLAIGGDWRLIVDDGTGPLEVLLDGTAEPQFRPAAARAVYAVGSSFRIVGVLVPTATPGVWRLKPRSAGDIPPCPCL